MISGPSGVAAIRPDGVRPAIQALAPTAAVGLYSRGQIRPVGISTLEARQPSAHVSALITASANGDATMMRKPAAIPLSGHRAVWLSSDGLRYADPSDETHSDAVIGITTYAALTGQDVLVQSAGEMIEPSWIWTPHEPLFVGTDGHLTQVPPSSGLLIEIGMALTQTSILIRIQQGIFL